MALLLFATDAYLYSGQQLHRIIASSFPLAERCQYTCVPSDTPHELDVSPEKRQT